MTTGELARLRGPIGLDLGGRAPAETALAIMAEIVADRHGGSGGRCASWRRPERRSRRTRGHDRRRTGVTDRGSGDGPAPVGAVVLAAGPAPRFGGGKLLAPLDGRPILAHVLDAVRAAGPAETVVVLGHGAAAIERRDPWAGERRVVQPGRRSAACRARSGSASRRSTGPAGHLDGVFVLLGDQPLVDPAVLRALARAEVRDGIGFVAPRYVGGGGSNPVLVLGAGRRWIDEATGDRGLGPILAAHPELVDRGRARRQQPGRRHAGRPGSSWPGATGSGATASRSIGAARSPTAPTSTAR